MKKELIDRYVEYLNSVIKIEENPNEAYVLELKRDYLIDILEDRNACVALERLALTCPDEEIVGKHECLSVLDGFTCHCEECWKNLLNI